MVKTRDLDIYYYEIVDHYDPEDQSGFLNMYDIFFIVNHWTEEAIFKDSMYIINILN